MRKVVHGLTAALALAVAVGLGCPDFVAGQDKKKDRGKDLRPTAAAGAVFELYKDTAGEYRFRLRGDEGVLLATSGKGYKDRADCLKVIDSIRTLAARAKVEDMTAVPTGKSTTKGK
jgi:uncharacterized protein YegP (UPF0339 family)